ncbi:MAG: nucleotidyltransferase substrate binding protein [Fusobacteriota bacterium]
MKEDIRWIQRFNNFKKVFSQLEEAVNLHKQRKLSKLEKQGTIKAFEFTNELAWKTLKDFLESKGNQDIYGSRDAVRESFKYGLISDGDIWMQMIKSRNLSSHTYDESTMDEIIKYIMESYYLEFKKVMKKLEDLKNKEGQK